jgi:dolichol-phosphate mannosyltransferase
MSHFVPTPELRTPPDPPGWLGRLAALAARVVPARFVKFAVVGLSGMCVNMAALLVLADGLDIHTNVAAAAAIEISIVSNFVLNDRWTFADRTGAAAAIWVRALRFHAVSGIGALVQWTTFVLANFALATALTASAPSGLLESVAQPPAVGGWKYVSQLLGIGLAAVWNFVANLAWTWRHARARAPTD